MDGKPVERIGDEYYHARTHDAVASHVWKSPDLFMPVAALFE